MNRKEAAELLPIIKAYAEGKEIEGLYKGTKSPWFKIKDMDFNEGIIFRIKPEPKYRPFKDAEECWHEMLKHQPFGWVKAKNCWLCSLITSIDTDEGIYINGIGVFVLDEIMEHYTFVDGTPFGVLEEK